MTEVGVQWVFTELWAVWLEPGTEEREGVRTFLCLSLCLPNCSSGALRVRPNLIPRCLHRPTTGPGTLSINIPLVREGGWGAPRPG